MLFYNALDLNNQKMLCLSSIYQFERTGTNLDHPRECLRGWISKDWNIETPMKTKKCSKSKFWVSILQSAAYHKSAQGVVIRAKRWSPDLLNNFLWYNPLYDFDEGLKGKGETKDIPLLIIWRPPGPPGVSKDVQLSTELGFGSLLL